MRGYTCKILEIIHNAELIPKFRARCKLNLAQEEWIRLGMKWEKDPRAQLLYPSFPNVKQKKIPSAYSESASSSVSAVLGRVPLSGYDRYGRTSSGPDYGRMSKGPSMDDYGRGPIPDKHPSRRGPGPEDFGKPVGPSEFGRESMHYRRSRPPPPEGRSHASQKDEKKHDQVDWTTPET
eukprot:UN34262